MTAQLDLRSTGELDEAEVAAVRALVDEAARTDSFSSLNEAGLLHLQHPRDAVRHVLAVDEPTAELLGYGQVEGGPATSTGLLVVTPGARRQGVGSALLGALLAAAPTPLQVWAVGDTAAAQALAARAGLVRSRELLVMTRPLADPVPPPRFPDGVAVRAFVPGRDEQAWLAVNARAFASHPEQGSLTAADLAERMAEPWFDPAGFFLAESGIAAARVPLDQAAPGRAGRGVRAGRRPRRGRPGAGRGPARHRARPPAGAGPHDGGALRRGRPRAGGQALRGPWLPHGQP